MSYEYKVVPAPVRGLKAKGIKSAEDRFAHALETAMNELAGDGWEYLRADTLPCEQREGLMSKTTVFQNMLVFRRAKKDVEAHPAPKVEAPKVEPKVTTRVAPPVIEKPDSSEEVEPTPIKPAPRPAPDVAAE